MSTSVPILLVLALSQTVFASGPPPPSTTTTTATPKPTAAPSILISNCTVSLSLHPYDSCSGIANAFNLTAEVFTTLNPRLDCTGTNYFSGQLACLEAESSNSTSILGGPTNSQPAFAMASSCTETMTVAQHNTTCIDIVGFHPAGTVTLLGVWNVGINCWNLPIGTEVCVNGDRPPLPLKSSSVGAATVDSIAAIPPPLPCLPMTACSMWAGVNMFYLYNLPISDQKNLLSALQKAGVTKVRVWVTLNYKQNKGTSSYGQPDLEMDTIGVYDDTVLNNLDSLIAITGDYGIKLLITMHDRWVLDHTFWVCDAYCKSLNYGSQASQFYTDPQIQSQFDNRLAHIINHPNPLMGGRRWADIPESIYAFEIQNEGQGGMNLPNRNWWCDRATSLRKAMGPANGILISTGGGQNFAESIISENFACAAIDLIGIHSYDSIDMNLVNQAVSSATASGKIIVFEEFGGTGDSKSWTLQSWASLGNSLRVPWMPWQVSTANNYGDYEFSPDDSNTWGVLTQFAQAAK